jgi:Metallopeptidase family M81
VRVAIAGITHEALGTSPLHARLDDFHVLRGQEVLTAAPYHLDALARQLDVALVPILTATHIAPSGTVELATYLQLRDEILNGLVGAGPLDGVCLLLHGTMLVEHIWSGKADLVREIRAALGDEVRIAASFDLGASNLTCVIVLIEGKDRSGHVAIRQAFQLHIAVARREHQDLARRRVAQLRHEIAKLHDDDLVRQGLDAGVAKVGERPHGFAERGDDHVYAADAQGRRC